MSNWTDTKITRRLHLSYPIIQGPFGRGGSTALLTATVSNAGGLGSHGANDQGPAEITKTAAEIRKLTDKPFGMNLWVSTYDPGGETLTVETYERVVKLLQPYYKELKIDVPSIPKSKPQNFDDQVAALIEARPAVFSFVFGITGRWARGIYHRFASEMKMHEPLFAKYPAHSWIIAPLRAAALAQGRFDLVGLWAGQAAPLCRHRKSNELFASLVKETDGLLKNQSLP